MINSETQTDLSYIFPEWCWVQSYGSGIVFIINIQILTTQIITHTWRKYLFVLCMCSVCHCWWCWIIIYCSALSWLDMHCMLYIYYHLCAGRYGNDQWIWLTASWCLIFYLYANLANEKSFDDLKLSSLIVHTKTKKKKNITEKDGWEIVHMITVHDYMCKCPNIIYLICVSASWFHLIEVVTTVENIRTTEWTQLNRNKKMICNIFSAFGSREIISQINSNL